MQLLVEEFDSTPLRQEITIGTQDLYLNTVRPHLYKHNSPSGELVLRLLDSNQRVIKETSALTVAAWEAAESLLDFAHQYVSFEIDTPLKSGTTYYVELEAQGGYSFSESAYLGWCYDYDLRKVSADYTPNAGYNSAFDFEFWARKNQTRS